MPSGQLGFFTVDPATGKITYTFQGRVAARGIDLLASLNSNEIAERRMAWHDSGQFTGAPTAVLWSGRTYPGPTSSNQLTLYSVTPNGLGQCALQLYQSDASADNQTQILANIQPVTGVAKKAVILNGLGQSNFLQLAILAGLKMDHGTVACTWNGTAAIGQVVNHALGVVPSRVLLLVGSNVDSCPQIAAKAATTFTLRLFTPGVPPVNGTVQNVDWVALG